MRQHTSMTYRLIFVTIWLTNELEMRPILQKVLEYSFKFVLFFPVFWVSTHFTRPNSTETGLNQKCQLLNYE